VFLHLVQWYLHSLLFEAAFDYGTYAHEVVTVLCAVTVRGAFGQQVGRFLDLWLVYYLLLVSVIIIKANIHKKNISFLLKDLCTTCKENTNILWKIYPNYLNNS